VIRFAYAYILLTITCFVFQKEGINGFTLKCRDPIALPDIPAKSLTIIGFEKKYQLYDC
jgi:hypothetical protein